MASFIIYDLAFMILFGILAFLFFKKNKKNVKRQGWIFLYHSKVGIKWMDAVVDRFDKILKPTRYLVVGVGYILMITMIWMIGFAAYRYITSPIPKQLQGMPPIAPLIPYFPKLFGMESFFPPLYFTYFLVALAIVAVSHEFAHGVFARLHKIKVKTTGLAFFGPFFGAFVEPDEKQMQKAKKFPQLSVLAAGVFANVLMTIIFVLLLWCFFTYSFEPAGVTFNTYSQSIVSIPAIASINGNSIDEFSQVEEFYEEGLNKITVQNKEFWIPNKSLEKALEENLEQVIVFDDTPAINADLRGVISKINENEIDSREELISTLKDFSPGEIVKIETIQEGMIVNFEIELSDRNGNAFLGIGFYEPPVKGFSGFLRTQFYKIKDPFVYYVPSWDGNFVQFIYDLLWWIVVINILVALFNMLPIALLDGGRFFYLTLWGITGSEKIGKKAFSYATWAILAVLALMMARWMMLFIS